MRAVLELRREEGAGRSTLTLRNVREVAGRHRVTTPSQNRKKGRGWHTNREGGRSVLVSHLTFWCPNPKRLRAVIEFRHEEGGRPYIKVATRGGRHPQPESSQRRMTGSQAVLVTDEYLTLGWIQPRDKPVSGFDRLPPYLYKASTFHSVEDDVAALPW